MKYYNTKDKEKAIFLVAIILIMVVVTVWLAVMPAEAHTEPDYVYPMVNQRITWEGAGYDGFRGGAGR